jgi:hypothetical protein
MLADLVQQQRQALSQEISRQFEVQDTQSRALETQRLEELQKTQAHQLASEIEQQRQSLSQELSRQLAAQAAQSQELLAKSACQQQGELQKSQAQQLATQIDQLRQSLEQELSRQVEAQGATTSQDVLARLEEQRLAMSMEQTSRADAVAKHLQTLLASLEQLSSQQSQLSSRLAKQEEQLRATREAMVDWQSRDIKPQSLPASDSEIDLHPAGAVDRLREMNVAFLDSDAQHVVAPPADSAISATEASLSAVDFEQPLERKAPIPEDDRLLHFVSDRLAQMDTGRQRRVVVYWVAAIVAVLVLAAGAWGLWYWLAGQPS